MGAALRRALLDSWSGRGPLTWVLWPVSLLYGWLVAARRALYRAGVWKSVRLPVPVIVVGNVVAGGSGKTPLVMAVVHHLRSRGLQVGVISRGYGGRDAPGCREVRADARASDVGDEPLLLKRATQVPVFVARRRADAARCLLRAHPEVSVLVADDGLQHLGLHRDLEVCVFDASGAGNGLLLPAGPLREPWPRPVDLVLAAGPMPGDNVWRVHRRLADRARRADGEELELTGLAAHAASAGTGLWAVAGIAHPEAFFGMLRAAGVPLAGTVALADHASFDAAHWPHDDRRMLVCTEKDAVKLWQHRPDAWAVPLSLHIGEGFWTRLDALLQSVTEAKLSSGHGHTTA